MDRRSLTLAALLSALAPASPGGAALVRVELGPALGGAGNGAAPAATTLTVSAAVPFTGSAPSPVVTAPALTLAPAASMAAAMPVQSVVQVPVALYAAAPAPPHPVVALDADGRPTAVITLRQAAATASRAPADLSRVFDAAAAAPAAPDFDALTPVRTPPAPTPWRPRVGLLKPFADAVNAVRGAAHERRLRNLPPERRLTSEETGLRQGLLKVHSALVAGRYQDALTLAASYFLTDAAGRWYEANPRFSAYREQGREYIRHAERAVMDAYLRADDRGADRALVAEARAAAAAGATLGHPWRPTPMQEKDTGTCVQNSLFNAIAASVGFARPTTVAQFVAASRELLNREARLDRPAGPGEIAALARELDIDLGRFDAAEGMGSRSLKAWADALGVALTPRAPPRAAAEWDALLTSGRENLLSLRMFHPRFRHTDLERLAKGHDHMILHHEVYLLGAFDSPSLGRRLYLLQDSGSGSTLMATAEELSALTSEVQQVSPAAPVSLALH